MTQIASQHPVAPRNGRPVRSPVTPPNAVAPATSAVSAAPATPRRPARPSLFVAPAVVVLGRDERGKPRASWFGEADVRAAERAAQLMGMRSLGVAGGGEALAALASRLPSGRLFESGRAFVPFVKGDLYDQLVAYLPAEAIAGGEGSAGDGTSADEGPGQVDTSATIAAAPKRKGGRRKAATTEAAPGDTDADAPSGDDGDGGNHDGGSGDGNGGSDDDDGDGDGDGNEDDDASAPDDGHRPTGWPAIRLGSLVLATEGAAEGWFEAVVDQALENDNFILRWRDWPDEPHFARNRNQLALLPTGRLTWAKRS